MQKKMFLPLQVGLASLHLPSSEHVTLFAPCSSKPGSQPKLQVELGRSSDPLHWITIWAPASGLWQVTAGGESEQ